MPKVGDRVIIEGSKVGQQRREGSLIGVTGRLLNVRWSDGTTSLLTPGAGSVRFLAKGSNGSTGTRKASPAKKAVSAGKKVQPVAKPAAKGKGSRSKAGGRKVASAVKGAAKKKTKR